jgi:hypothetical protein
LLGHVIAARINGGGRIAYVHHVLGFFLIAAVTGLLIAGATWLFWRGRRNRALLTLGLVQLLFGIAVILAEWRAR